jgi:hypothetical protein
VGRLDHQKFGTWAQIVTACAAVVGFVWIGTQVWYARANLQFQSVTSYALLTSACRQQVASTPTPSSLQIKLWNDLCEARVLSHEIVINDLLRATASHSLINLKSAQDLSVQLEDGVVRELNARARIFLESKRPTCTLTDDELHRVQEVFKAVYMFDKPRKTFDSEIDSHKEDKKQHSDSEHATAFLSFVEAVQDIGASCRVPP